MTTLRRRFVDAPNSIGGKARSRRSERLLRLFPDLIDMDVLDLGGTLSFWKRLPVRPRSVTTINPEGAPMVEGDWFESLLGDACQPPSTIENRSFDLVFSNSTIEHVGDVERRQVFADVVHRSADRHWIQTPNRAFPIEPHVLFPLHQFLPRTAQALVYRYWPLCHTNATSMASAHDFVAETELIRRAEFAELFPASEIVDEEFIPLLPPKSLMAIKA